MWMGWKVVGRLAALALLPCACGGGRGGGGNSGPPADVPRDALVGSLTTQQLGALCDWINASVGGYGSIDNCDGGGSRYAATNQQSCIDALCYTLTAGETEDCVSAIGGDLCRADTEPKCMVACPTFDGGLD
jgi:hypothetical protein